MVSMQEHIQAHENIITLLCMVDMIYISWLHSKSVESKRTVLTMSISVVCQGIINKDNATPSHFLQVMSNGFLSITDLSIWSQRQDIPKVHFLHIRKTTIFSLT